MKTIQMMASYDISIRGRGISGTRALDCDIKIYSLHDADSLKTTTLPPADCVAQAIRFLKNSDSTRAGGACRV